MTIYHEVKTEALEELPLDQLEEASAEFLRGLTAVKEQLLEAKADAASSGIYADRDWYRRVSRAKSYLGTRYNLTLRLLAASRQEARKAAKQARAESAERLFITVARQRLPGALYDEIWAEVHTQQAATGGLDD